MFFQDLFKKLPSAKKATVGDFESEIQYASSRPASRLPHNNEIVQNILKPLHNIDMFGGCLYQNSEVLHLKIPDEIDCILHVQENLICYMGLDCDGTLVIPDDVYSYWVNISNGDITRIENPILLCIHNIHDLLISLEIDYRRLAVEVRLPNEINIVGGPIISNRIRVGTEAQMKAECTSFPGGITIAGNAFNDLNEKIYRYIRLPYEQVKAKKVKELERSLCPKCKAVLAPGGGCPFCALFDKIEAE